MALDLNGKKKATCIDCGKQLGFNDFICCIDPYSPEGMPKPKRVNLCQKCYDQRKDKKDKMLGEKDMEGETETILSSDDIYKMIREEIEKLPPEQQPSSTSQRKKAKLEKKIRRELIRRYKEQMAKKELEDSE